MVKDSSRNFRCCLFRAIIGLQRTVIVAVSREEMGVLRVVRKARIVQSGILKYALGAGCITLGG